MLLLASMVSGVAGVVTDGQYRKSYSANATRLFNDLFSDDSPYNLHIPPTSSNRSFNGSAAGTDVSANLRVFKLVEVNPSQAYMSLKVWLRMQWIDERLAWDPTEYGGVTQIAVPATNPENRVIWTPDLIITNSRVSNAESFEEVYALLDYTGAVYWSRPGLIDVLCQFSGLVGFPFDRLSCQVELMGWVYSGVHQGLQLLEGGADLDKSEPASRASYQELSVQSVHSKVRTYTYPCCPNDPYPSVEWTFYLGRASSYYVEFYLWPAVIVTMLSFGAFFMSPDVGERLGFGITLVLTVEVGKVIFQELLPVCGELLWIEVFNMVALVFCYISLFESIIVLFLAHHEGSRLLPRWFIDALQKIGCLSKDSSSSLLDDDDEDFEEPQDGKPESMTEENLQFESSAALLYRVFNSSVLLESTKDHVRSAPPSYGMDSLSYLSTRPPEVEGSTAPRVVDIRRPSNQVATAAALSSVSPPASPPPADDFREESRGRRRRRRHHDSAADLADAEPLPGNGNDFVRDAEGLLRPTHQLGSADASRLVFFENLFFTLDFEAAGELSVRDCSRALSFLAFDIAPKERHRVMRAADANADGHLQRWEWVELCAALLWKYPMAQLELAAKNYLAAQASVRDQNSARWRAAGKKVDIFCRFTVIPTHIFCLGLLFNADFHDPYGDGRNGNGYVAPEQPSEYDGTFMFQRFWRISMTGRGFAIAIVAPIILVLLASFVLFENRLYRRKMNKQSAAALDSSKEVIAKRTTIPGNIASSSAESV